MSEKAPDTSNRVENVHKAWAMAHAEKPVRDSLLEEMSQRSEELNNRYAELVGYVEEGQISNLSDATKDEIRFIQDQDLNAKHFTPSSGKYNPMMVLEAAKSLVENDDWHRNRALRNSANSHTMNNSDENQAHPEDPIIATRKEFKQSYDPTDLSYIRASIERSYKDDLRKVGLEKPIDPSRSKWGDIKAEEAGKMYDIIHPEEKAE